MVVRIRLGKGPRRSLRNAEQRRVAQGIAALLSPAALMAAALGAWDIAAAFRWANAFAISSGLFSHWQVWLGAAALLQFASFALNRYGRTDRTAS